MKKILLQTCCAPCVTTCVEVLRGNLPWEKVLEYKPEFDHIAIYFYNPNIHPYEEYLKRAEQAQQYAEIINTEFIIGEYDKKEWREEVRGFEREPEKGERCTICYAMRLKNAFLYAKDHGFEAVASSLTLSPHKDEKRVNSIGQNLEQETGITYLVSNFKKNNGFKIAKEISKDSCIYCQDYCGCEFSLRDKILRNLQKQNKCS